MSYPSHDYIAATEIMGWEPDGVDFSVSPYGDINTYRGKFGHSPWSPTQYEDHTVELINHLPPEALDKFKVMVFEFLFEHEGFSELKPLTMTLMCIQAVACKKVVK